MSIRKKFFLLGLIGFFSLLLLSLLSLNINQKGFDNLSHVFDDFKRVHAVQSVYIEPLFELKEITLTLVMSPNKEFKRSADEKLTPAISKLDEAFKKSEKELVVLWQTYKQSVLLTREYALSGFDEGAFMNAISNEREQFYALIEALREVQKLRLEDSHTTFEDAQKKTDKSHYLIVFSFFIVGLSGFLFDFVIVRRIIYSIEKVQVGLKQFFLSLSNIQAYDQKNAIELDSNDELGIMAKAINEQVNTIQEALKNDYDLIQEATATVEELKEGHFGKRLMLVASSNEINKLKDVMNEMLFSLEQKIQEEIAHRTDHEKLLVQQSKLAAMGNMLGNIAHQWRQPLSEINAILMEVEAISRYGTLEKEHLLGSIKACYDVTEHMSQTIIDFQAFFRPSKSKELFSVAEACKSATAIINASLKFHTIELVFTINEDSQIYGYKSEFAHAILNVLSNAKDVLTERKIPHPRIGVKIQTGKLYTLIRIEDNGGGIAQEHLEKVFEPYFTTKHAKRGTGIGLYMTKMIIEDNMQGIISAQNYANGALFTIKVRKNEANA